MRRSIVLPVPVALVAALLLGAPGSAGAATVTVVNQFSPPATAWSYTVSMGAGVTALRVEKNPGGPGFRISEDGDVVSLTQPAGGPCTPSAGALVCTALPISGGITVTNTGGSAAAPLRDRIVFAGAAHGDPAATWSPVAGNLSSTGGLVELWLGPLGGRFTGSDIAAGTLEVPADVVHASGASGTSCSAAFPCDLGSGADRYEGAAGAVVTGGAGSDVLLGGPGDETLSGGPGDDVVGGGGGKDVLSGGADLDTLTFDEPGRTDGLLGTFSSGTAGTLGGGAYDTATSPATGTGDAYDASFESLVASPVADTIVGGPGADRIDGAGGADALDGSDGDDRLSGGTGGDVLTGGPGLDGFFGGDGDDVLRARDGIAETLDCGAGDDPPEADATDVLKDCEVPAPVVPGPTTGGLPATPVPSVAAATPGPTTGPPATSPGPRAIGPLAVTLRSRASAGRRTRFRTLAVHGAPVGATVLLRCRGRAGACPLRSRTVRVRRAGDVALAPFLKRRLLRPGVVLTITVTAPGRTGRSFRLTVRRGRTPSTARSCVTPAGRPARC